MDGPWSGGKSRLPPGFDPRTFQPLVSRYTDRAVRPTKDTRFMYETKEDYMVYFPQTVMQVTSMCQTFQRFYVFEILKSSLNDLVAFLAPSRECMKIRSYLFSLKVTCIMRKDLTRSSSQSPVIFQFIPSINSSLILSCIPLAVNGLCAS